jgi:hypothetical protein
MFASPEFMYREEIRGYEMEAIKHENVLDALDEYKLEAIQKIEKITDVFYTDAIALTIASGYELELESSIDIVNRLGLNDKHIAGILNDYKMMEKIIDDETEDQNDYENSLNEE